MTKRLSLCDHLSSLKEENSQFLSFQNKELYSIIETARAFERSIYQCIYIVDNINNNFLYVSDNFIKLCGVEADQVKKMGYDFWNDSISEEDYILFTEARNERLKFLNNLPMVERTEYSLSLNFHIKYGNKNRLINFTSTAINLTTEGDLGLELCIISFSGRDKAGDIVMKGINDKFFSQYSMKNHCWNRFPEISLTDSEREVLILSSQGLPMKIIADLLNKSLDTVKTYKRHLFYKMKVNSIAAALTYAQNHILI